MNSKTQKIRKMMRNIIESKTTEQVEDMLRVTITQMNEHEAGTTERANLGAVYIMIAEVLEDRIGVAAVEAIEDEMFEAVA